MKIYNLCIEPDKQYKKIDFPGFKLNKFPMTDHNVCSLKTIFNFCLDAALYLRAEHPHSNNDPLPIVAVHCKAGKGRTGLMVASLLIFLQVDEASSDVSAIKFYDFMRTKNKKGLTITSQIRYVNSFYLFLKREVGFPFFRNSLFDYVEIQKKLDERENPKNTLRIFALTLGPFAKPETQEVSLEVIKLLKDNNTESVFSLGNVDRNLQSSIIETFDKGPCEHYTIIKFLQQDRLMNSLKLSGDFKLKVKVGNISFYLWLNVRDIQTFAEAPDAEQRLGRYQKLRLEDHLHYD